MASARVFLATVSLVAIWVDPTDPERYLGLTYALLAIYVAHTIAVLIYLQFQRDVSQRFAIFLQSVDIFWPALISLITQGPSSPFYVLYLSALLAAGFRWGLVACMATSITGMGINIAQAAILLNSEPWIAGQFEVNRLVIRCAYLLLMGIVLGYFSQEEKHLRAEEVIIARTVRRASSVERSLRTAMHQVLAEIADLFGASQVLVAIREAGGGRFYVWQYSRVHGQSPETHLAEMAPTAAAQYLFPAKGSAWVTARARSGDWRATQLDSLGHRLREATSLAPPAQLAQSAASILGVDFSFGESWVGRLLLLDPHLQASADREVRFAQKLFQQVSPALYNLYLVRRLRSRAGAIERARAARELHDGAIQSLIAAEMQVDVLRRRGEAAGSMSTALAHIQGILRQEVLSLRELMHQIRPVDIGPRDLTEFLAETVDRFRRDTGIEAHFIADSDEIPFPRRVCRELVRITQEALVNVRKHAAARQVHVRLSVAEGGWRLTVEDDGRGFPATANGNGNGKGSGLPAPTVLSERAKLIGAEVHVYSVPGEGTRIEVAVPRAASAAYAG